MEEHTRGANPQFHDGNTWEFGLVVPPEWMVTFVPIANPLKD
jgi:hypothetical protein